MVQPTLEVVRPSDTANDHRGGVPVCFPQFSDFGPLAQHGFARNSAFEVLEATGDSVSLVLRSSEESRKLWPHDFELVIAV